MIPEYNPESRTLTVDNQTFKITKRRLLKSKYDYFSLEDGRRIITDGNIFFFCEGAALGRLHMDNYLNRPPLPHAITIDSILTDIDEGIAIYKAITGACDGGVAAFVALAPIPPFPNPITTLLTVTQGYYGSDLLREYFFPTGRRLFDGLLLKRVPSSIKTEKELLELELQTAANPSSYKEKPNE